MEKSSEKQQKLFFLLLQQLDLDKEAGIERAKKRFKAEHLKDLTVDQMAEIIDILKAKQKKATPSKSAKYKLWDRANNCFITDTDWKELRELGWYFDWINGDMRQVITIDPYEERIVRDIDLLQSTGRLDYFGKEMFCGDLFHDRSKTTWLIDYSDKDLAWVARSQEDGTIRLLSTFSAVKITGNLYEVKGGEDI